MKNEFQQFFVEYSLNDRKIIKIQTSLARRYDSFQFLKSTS